MTVLDQFLNYNRNWVAENAHRAPREHEARPTKVFWIGCCDGPFDIAPRLGFDSDDLFIHRNLANIVCGSDANGLAALQYAVDELQVQHIIVCGHSACGGILAAMSDESLGVTDQWLSEIFALSHPQCLTGETALDAEGLSQLCAGNVHAQVNKLCHARVLRDAWQRHQEVSVHGWMFDEGTRLFRNLRPNVGCTDQGEPCEAVISTGNGDHCHEKRVEPNDANTA
jgi:carbonic anhydrase